MNCFFWAIHYWITHTLFLGILSAFYFVAVHFYISNPSTVKQRQIENYCCLFNKSHRISNKERIVCNMRTLHEHKPKHTHTHTHTEQNFIFNTCLCCITHESVSMAFFFRCVHLKGYVWITQQLSQVIVLLSNGPLSVHLSSMGFLGEPHGSDPSTSPCFDVVIQLNLSSNWESFVCPCPLSYPQCNVSRILFFLPHSHLHHHIWAPLCSLANAMPICLTVKFWLTT